MGSWARRASPGKTLEQLSVVWVGQESDSLVRFDPADLVDLAVRDERGRRVGVGGLHQPVADHLVPAPAVLVAGLADRGSERCIEGRSPPRPPAAPCPRPARPRRACPSGGSSRRSGAGARGRSRSGGGPTAESGTARGAVGGRRPPRPAPPLGAGSSVGLILLTATDGASCGSPDATPAARLASRRAPPRARGRRARRPRTRHVGHGPGSPTCAATRRRGPRPGARRGRPGRRSASRAKARAGFPNAGSTASVA